jgi:hypothetical protein
MLIRLALLPPVMLLCCGVCGAARAQPNTQILLLADSDPSQLVDLAARQLGQSPRLQVIPLAALSPLMQQRDAERNLLARITALREESRQALLALADERATTKLDEALALAQGGFVRFYEPALLAQLHLLRAIAALNQARPELAREDFLRAHQLDGALVLDAHYSPQVRQAFDQALAHGPTPSAPPASGEAARLLELQPEARWAVVLAADAPQASTLLIKGLVLERGSPHYTLIEASSISLAPAAAAQQRARELGAKLRGWFDARLAPALLATPSPAPRPRAKTAHRRWYTRWYVLAAAAVVVGGVATALPLAFQRDVVALDVRW